MSDKPKFLVPANRKTKGRALTRIDQEYKIINSGPLGSERLLINVALDFMEKYRGLRANRTKTYGKRKIIVLKID
ncbi:hypothetical protein KV860_004389 [Escherichia coli]|nr:hypothetical protein [Escherichia coli]EHS5724953.1 hypothetical protein [Escherichia coli]HBQ4703298.1 hypothetical protein [Escherichia coli]